MASLFPLFKKQPDKTSKRSKPEWADDLDVFLRLWSKQMNALNATQKSALQGSSGNRSTFRLEA